MAAETWERQQTKSQWQKELFSHAIRRARERLRLRSIWGEWIDQVDAQWCWEHGRWRLHRLVTARNASWEPVQQRVLREDLAGVTCTLRIGMSGYGVE